MNNSVLAFGAFELDEDRWELRRLGRPVPVQPKVLALLLYLVRHRHRVVPKQELLATLWPDAVVTDASLMRAICLARRALDERGDDGGLIRTHRRRGYRFTAAVLAVDPAETALPAVPTSPQHVLGNGRGLGLRCGAGPADANFWDPDR